MSCFAEVLEGKFLQKLGLERRGGAFLLLFFGWVQGVISRGMLAKTQTCRAYGKRLTMRLKPADIRKGIGYSSCRPAAGIAQFRYGLK